MDHKWVSHPENRKTGRLIISCAGQAFGVIPVGCQLVLVSFLMK
jgi:hypothetical protein